MIFSWVTVAKIAADRNLDISNEAGLLEAAEEFVATFAENGTENTIWQRIAAAFRNFLRNLGFDLEYSDSELRSLLSRGLRDLQGSVVKDNLTTDGGVRYLAEPFTEAQKREILAMVPKNGVDVVKKILYGGSITRNGNTVHFDGKNSHQIKKHLVGEGLSPVEGFIGFDDIEFILPKALETQWEPDRKKNKKGRKKTVKRYTIFKDGVRFRLVTEFNGDFLSFYSDRESVDDVHWGNPGSASSQRFGNNISQNPENANPENANPKKSGSARHSVANDGGFRSSDPHKEELWAKFIVKIANANYINTAAAAALLLDHGIRITPRDEQTLVAACVIARDMVRQRNARMRKSADVKAMEKKDEFYKIIAAKYGSDFKINAGPAYDGSTFTGSFMDTRKTEKGRAKSIPAADIAKLLSNKLGREISEKNVVEHFAHLKKDTLLADIREKRRQKSELRSIEQEIEESERQRVAGDASTVPTHIKK